MVCASISPWLPLTVPDFWCGFCVQCCLEAESQKQGEVRVVLPLLFLNALKRRGCAMLRHVAPGVVWKFWFNDEECRFPVSCGVGS